MFRTSKFIINRLLLYTQHTAFCMHAFDVWSLIHYDYIHIYIYKLINFVTYVWRLLRCTYLVVSNFLTSNRGISFFETGEVILCYEIKMMQDRRCMLQHNIGARSRNHCCRRKTLSITYSECVSVALGIRHAVRLRVIILSALTCRALQYFTTSSHKRHDFRRKYIGFKICVLILHTNVSCRISHSKKNWARYDKTCVGVPVQYRYSCQILYEACVSSTDFRKILKYQISWKSA